MPAVRIVTVWKTLVNNFWLKVKSPIVYGLLYSTNKKVIVPEIIKKKLTDRANREVEGGEKPSTPTKFRYEPKRQQDKSQAFKNKDVS